jgi:hypothetical protein
VDTAQLRDQTKRNCGGPEDEFDDAGQGDPNEQRQAPLGSTNPPESHDSWRPTADPAAGDMAPESDREDQAGQDSENSGKQN